MKANGKGALGVGGFQRRKDLNLMIRITCCRLGRFPRSNIEEKGIFIKEFDNMQQLAAFVRGSFNSLFFPKIKEELNRKQYKELVNKLESLRRNRSKGL